VRTPTERLLGVLLLLLFSRTFLLEGFPVPCQVGGGSMAETLLGSHYEVACPDCGFPFVCEAAGASAGYQTVCPNCGYPVWGREAPPEIAGDRVLIDRTALAFGPPRRWQVVAFMRPGSSGEMLVKRVVGLPGETVAIRRGDVYIDGRIQRKTLAQQRAVRILVHDADFRPTIEPTLPPRWQSTSGSAGGWHWAAGGFSCRGSTAGRVDWLVYKHWRRGAEPGAIVPSPVVDLCSYNQGRPRRKEDVYPVADLMLSVRLVEVQGGGRLWLRASDGLEEFQVEIDPRDQHFTVFRGGCDTPVVQGNLPMFLDGEVLEVSLFDQQFLLAVGGRTAAAIAYDRPGGDPPGSREPLAIGCQDLEVVLKDVKVYRDIYYSHPAGRKDFRLLEHGVCLGDGEFFVLGDNSPISEDSWTWSDDWAVRAEQLIGRPFLVVLPARGARLGRRFFQVPDPGRIRYIR
jgi:signal peptidase I